MPVLPAYTVWGNNAGTPGPRRPLTVAELQAMGLGGSGGVTAGDKGHITVGAGGGWSINAGVITAAMMAAANVDGTAATPSLRTLGTGAAQAAAGDHTHAGGGGLSADDVAALQVLL